MTRRVPPRRLWKVSLNLMYFLLINYMQCNYWSFQNGTHDNVVCFSNWVEREDVWLAWVRVYQGLFMELDLQDFRFAFPICICMTIIASFSMGSWIEFLWFLQKSGTSGDWQYLPTCPPTIPMKQIGRRSRSSSSLSKQLQLWITPHLHPNPVQLILRIHQWNQEGVNHPKVWIT